MNWLDCFQLSEVNNLNCLRGGSLLEFLMNKIFSINLKSKQTILFQNLKKKISKNFTFVFLEAGINKLINLMDLLLRLLKKQRNPQIR